MVAVEHLPVRYIATVSLFSPYNCGGSPAIQPLHADVHSPSKRIDLRLAKFDTMTGGLWYGACERWFEKKLEAGISNSLGEVAIGVGRAKAFVLVRRKEVQMSNQFKQHQQTII